MEKDILEIKSSDINVEVIMEEIRQKIKDKGIEVVEFPDMNTLVLKSIGAESTSFNTDNFEVNMLKINKEWNVNADQPITSHRKLIGGFIVFVKRLIRKCLRWYISPIADQIQQFNSSIVRTLNEIRKYVYSNNETIEVLNSKISVLEDMIQSLNPQSQFSEDIQKRTFVLEENVRGLNQSTKQTRDVSIFATERLSRLEDSLKRDNKSQAVQLENPQNVYPQEATNSQETGIDYLTFELLFRGNREKIKENQKRYLKYFEGKNNILDIGCGRGEFIELMLEAGKTGVKGIDLNENMVALCQHSGLPVEYADAVGYLSRLQPGELEGIYLGQVVEHMMPADIVKLVHLAYEKLKQGGMLIMETPNPTCLAIYANAFYIDFTHNKPVHPLTLEFVLQSQGFNDIEVIYFSEVEEKLPKLSGSGVENLDEINQGIDRLNNLLFGSQDYAIIGQK